MKNQFIFLSGFFLLFLACEKQEDTKPNNGKPFISAVKPASGRAGNHVNIIGGNFSKKIQENKVFFNGVQAETYAGIDEEIIVTVPNGSTTGPIAIVVPGYDTVKSEVFTIEQFLKPTLYWTGDPSIVLQKATFDEAGLPVIKSPYYVPPRDINDAYYFDGFSYEAATQTFYAALGNNTSLLIVKLKADSSLFDVLYDAASDPLLGLTEGILSPIVNLYHRAQLETIVTDFDQNIFYVTDVGIGKIYKGWLDGSQPLEVIFDDGIIAGDAPLQAVKPRGLALAKTSGYLYWVDAGHTISYVNNAVHSVMRTSLATHKTEVVYDGLDWPEAIVVDETRNRLYFTSDVNLQNGINVDCIWQGSLDGTLPLKKIFKGDGQVSSPSSLALDIENNQLYWSSIKRDQDNTNVIYRADLDEENPRIDELVTGSHVNGMSIRYFVFLFEE